VFSTWPHVQFSRPLGSMRHSDAVALDPQNYMAHYGYALSLIMGTLNDDLAAQAESSLRAAIKINPGFAPAYDSLAYLLALTWHNQNPDEAYRLAVAAAQLEPENVSYRVRAVNTLERLGRAEDAVRVANLAVSMAVAPQDRAAATAALASAKQFQAPQGASLRLVTGAQDRHDLGQTECFAHAGG